MSISFKDRTLLFFKQFEGHTECFNLELKNIIYDKFKK